MLVADSRRCFSPVRAAVALRVLRRVSIHRDVAPMCGEMITVSMPSLVYGSMSRVKVLRSSSVAAAPEYVTVRRIAS